MSAAQQLQNSNGMHVCSSVSSIEHGLPCALSAVRCRLNQI